MKLRELIPDDQIEAANSHLLKEAAEQKAPKDPLVLMIAIGFGSWLSALFVLGFLAMAFEPTEEGAIAMGAVLVAICAGIHVRAKELPVFFDQSILAFLAAGHLLLLFGISETFGSHNEATDYALTQTGLCVIGLLFYKKGIYRFSSLLLAVFLWVVSIQENESLTQYHLLLGVQTLLFAYVALVRSKTSSYTPALAASLLGSIFFFDMMQTHSVAGWVGSDFEATVWPANLCMVLLLALTCWRVIPNGSKHPIYLVLGLVLLLILAYASTAGLLLAVSLIILGRGTHNRLIEVLGLAGLFASVFYYYYSLQVSLLMKSVTMLLTGLVCLLIAAITYRLLKSEKESEVAA